MSARAWLGTNLHENPDSMNTQLCVSTALAEKMIQSVMKRDLVTGETTLEQICLPAAHIHK